MAYVFGHRNLKEWQSVMVFIQMFGPILPAATSFLECTQKLTKLLLKVKFGQRLCDLPYSKKLFLVFYCDLNDVILFKWYCILYTYICTSSVYCDIYLCISFHKGPKANFRTDCSFIYHTNLVMRKGWWDTTKVCKMWSRTNFP